jgi:nucleotide-binding universal stress UspA family protein
MYKHILVPLENRPTDKAILQHIRELAKLTHAYLSFLHVADGFMALNQNELGESIEIRRDREYLKKIETEFRGEGFDAEAVLVCGNPSEEILAFAENKKCDLIAMSTHGHRFLSDLILGSVASNVRHKTHIPVLLVRA